MMNIAALFLEFWTIHLGGLGREVGALLLLSNKSIVHFCGCLRWRIKKLVIFWGRCK